MPEESFEQQARNMAEQFSMAPQPIVWQRVKAAISPKRRRRAAFIWWTLALGVACGLGFWLLNDSKILHKKTESANKNITVKSNSGKIEKVDKTNESTNQKTDNHPTINSKRSVASTQKKNKDLLVLNHLRSQEEKGAKQKKEATLFQPQSQFVLHKNRTKEKDVKTNGDSTSIQSQTDVLANNNAASDLKNKALQNVQAKGSDTVKTITKTTAKTNDTLNKNKDSSLTSINKKKGKNKWHWGVTAEGGTSWLGNGLFGDQSKSLADFSSIPTGNVSGGSQSSSTYQQRKNGVDAALGIAAKTNLSKRWFLDGALTYRYQQFSIQTTSLSSLPTPLFGNIIRSNANYYFQSANLYTGIGLSIFHKKNTSIAVQAGMDNGWLLSIKQRHNDSLQTITAQGFHRWQPSLQVSFPIGIYGKGNVRWQLSPFVRWGLRGLQNSDGSFAHHPLSAAGIKATYFFK